MLVGRLPEQQALEALAAGARVGRSGVLVIAGEAGCGKTTLLEHLAGTLHDMQVTRVVGTEAERELSFGGLSQLVGHRTEDITDLPSPQARALQVALDLRSGAGTDRLAVGAGTLGILSHRAERTPLAVLVDDAHLLDHSSGQAFAFAARRLLADPVLLVATVRSGADSPLLQAGLPSWELAGLDTRQAQQLLAEHSGQHLTLGQVERLVRATGGNPLALIELGEDVHGIQSLGPADPLAVRTALARSFLARTERLSDAARQGLVVAACSDGDPLVVRAACVELGVDPAGLTEAADAQLVTGTRIIDFQHPLVRAAVVGAAAPELLRQVHLALATATPVADPDRRAWHRAAAATGPDAGVAAALDEVAGRARARSAHDVAATALERAGWLSPTPPLRTARLLAAAECAWLAGQGARALALLARAGILEAGTQEAGDPEPGDLVARAAHLHGTIAMRTGSVAEALTVYRSSAERLRDSDPDAAVELWADGVNAAFFRGDAAYLRAARTAIEQLGPRVTTQRSRVLGDLATGMAKTLDGQDGAGLIRASVTHLATTDTLHADPLRAEWLVLGPLYLREESRYRAIVHEALTETRDAAALGELAHLLLLVARDDATTDRWAQADAEYQESIGLARELGQTTDLALALASLAALEARRGRARDCRAHSAEAIRVSEDKGIVISQVWAGLALAELELGTGRAVEALSHLDSVEAVLRESEMHDMDLHPGPDRVEALVRLGKVDEARAEAREYHRLCVVKGQAWALARAERALALVAVGDDGTAADAHFAAAAKLHADTPDQFEAARTALAHGASLRRRRRRRDARAPLRAALADFERLGAEPRAEQAAVELAATGETVQRRGASRLTALTAQERQIAELLCSGRTTRQTAAALFLSPKTVEYHLRHVYTKLGVRSRSELNDALAER